MILIYLFFSAILLVACTTVHLATFFGFDVRTIFPYVMYLHILTLLMIVVAALYTRIIDRKTPGFKSDKQDKDLKQSSCWQAIPRWMKILLGIVAGYVFLNFFGMILLMEGGGPDQRPNGTYALTSHGRLIRPLTETEYHRYRSYEMRLFSGHWIAFSYVALMLLVGAWRVKRQLAAGLLVEQITEPSAETIPNESLSKEEKLPYRPPTGKVALAALAALIAVIMLLLVRSYPYGALASMISIFIGATCLCTQIRKKSWYLSKISFGFLAAFPCAIMAFLMTWYLQWFLYLVFAAGPVSAITGEVTIQLAKNPRQEANRLSNGEAIDGRILTMIEIVIWPVGIIFGVTGLIVLVDTVSGYASSCLKTTLLKIKDLTTGHL